VEVVAGLLAVPLVLLHKKSVRLHVLLVNVAVLHVISANSPRLRHRHLIALSYSVLLVAASVNRTWREWRTRLHKGHAAVHHAVLPVPPPAALALPQFPALNLHVVVAA
jgi:hypothetical protein|tara:strand:- start:427 stop:753 length:327 start_codon:yes stop_codon:yes gene_type:complete